MPRSHALLPIVLGPPPEVLEEIGEAWERAQEAALEGLELHFASDRVSRAHGEALRRGDGTVIERVPAESPSPRPAATPISCPPLALSV